MAKYRPDIKPPMWGPPDAVQYAVRVNSERVGIKPAWMIPLLEGAGTVASDVVGLGVATLSGLEWDVSDQSLSGFTYSGTQSLILPSNDIYRLAGQSSVTLIADIYLGSWGNEFPHIWSVRNASTQVSVFGVGSNVSINTPSQYRRPYVAQSTSNYGVSATNVVPENARSTLAFSAGNGNINFYLNGVNVGGSGGVGDFQTSTISPLIGNRVSGGRGLPNGKLYYVYAFHQQLSDPQIAQLHETPYALLMPVARPVYFDLGAGSSILYTINQSLASAISSSLILPATLQASIATTRSSAQDIAASILTDTTTRQLLLSAILTGAITQQQIQSMISTGLTTSHDLRLMLSAEIATLHDTLISISELTDSVVHQDLELRVSSAMAGQADLQAMISTAQTLRQEIQAIISTQLATTHDLSVQISELVGTIVRQDLSLTVSTELARVQELSARVSTELSATHDLSGSVATSLTTVQDLLADISSILSIVVRQDLSLAVSTEMVVLQDLLLQVDDHVQALLLGPVFTPRIIDLTPARTLIDLTPLREIREVLN